MIHNELSTNQRIYYISGTDVIRTETKMDRKMGFLMGGKLEVFKSMGEGEGKAK